MKTTPDSYIERNDYENEPPPPDPEDLCMICGKLKCDCKPDDLGASDEHIKRMVEFSKMFHKEKLTPKELADAITEVKRKHPEDFPQ